IGKPRRGDLYHENEPRHRRAPGITHHSGPNAHSAPYRGARDPRRQCARYMAERIPGAKLIELAGIDHSYIEGDREALLDEVEVFLTGARHVYEPERVLVTVLFADIVGSTERAAALGNNAWRELLAAFFAKVREVLRQYRGA